MDDKKLDLDKPLLSVRRNPSSPRGSSGRYDGDDKRISSSRFSTPQLPHYKSELKSGPIRDPGVVPFQWEQTPGLPKEKMKPLVHNHPRLPVAAPSLPPGRFGESKDAETAKFQHGSLKVCKETGGEGKSCSSGDGDEEFVDARDALSRTGSYLDCRMSDFTALDFEDNTRCNFSGDPGNRVLMMERFLPAAKALASEKPKYAPRKQALSAREPTKQVIVKQMPLTRDRPVLRYGLSFAKRYSHFGIDAVGEEEGEESDDEESEERHFGLAAGCGLLPRLLKGPDILKPVPGLSMRMRGSFLTTNRIRPASSSSSSLNVTEHLSAPKSTGPASFGGLKNIQHVVADKVNEKDSNSGSTASEKTVYVDTIQNKERTITSFDSRSQGSDVLAPREKHHEIAAKIMNQMEDIKTIDGEKLTDKYPSPTAFVEHQDLKLESTMTEKGEMLGKDSSDSNEQLSPIASAKSYEKQRHSQLPSQQSASDSNDSEQLQQLPTLEKANKKYSQFLAPPPLPKSPTDSWLFRTLPSMSSSKNASARSFLAPATNPQHYG